MLYSKLKASCYLESGLLLGEFAQQHFKPSLKEAVPHVVAVDSGKPEAPESWVVMAVVRHDVHHGEVQCECQRKPAQHCFTLQVAWHTQQGCTTCTSHTIGEYSVSKHTKHYFSQQKNSSFAADKL